MSLFLWGQGGFVLLAAEGSSCICQHNSATFSFSSTVASTELWYFKGPGIKDEAALGKHMMDVPGR